MNEKLKILILEDNPTDAELLKYELQRGGIEFVSKIVDTKKNFLKELKKFKPVLILADYNLPLFDGRSALKIVREEFSEIPFIFVSGAIGEEIAIETLKNGATDYVLKDRLNRLVPAVQRALKEYEEKNKRKEAEKKLRESDVRYRYLIESAGMGVMIDDKEGNFIYFNRKFAELFGYSNDEMNKKTISLLIYSGDIEKVKSFHNARINGKEVPSRYEFRGIKKDGSYIYLEVDTVLEKRGNTIIGTRSYIWDISERKKSEQKLLQSYKKLQDSLDTTVNALASTLEKRDPFTAGHQQRVSELACAIAEEMRLTKKRTKGVKIASLLHDIGKIGVPAEILSKPASLTESEFKLIKTHPQVAYDVLKKIKFSWPIAPIVLQHHEKMNGSGYPNGIHGKKILLESRIITVSDVVEAMSSHRPYRPARGIDAALDEIKKNKGKLYDINVADACVKIFKEQELRFEWENKEIRRD